MRGQILQEPIPQSATVECNDIGMQIDESRAAASWDDSDTYIWTHPFIYTNYGIAESLVESIANTTLWASVEYVGNLKIQCNGR